MRTSEQRLTYILLRIAEARGGAPEEAREEYFKLRRQLEHIAAGKRMSSQPLAALVQEAEELAAELEVDLTIDPSEPMREPEPAEEDKGDEPEADNTSSAAPVVSTYTSDDGED